MLILCVGTGTSSGEHDDMNSLVTKIQFQLFDKNKIEQYNIQPYLMFLNRGLPIISKLKAETSYSINSKKFKAHLLSLKGSPYLYVGISHNYPNEQILSLNISYLINHNEHHHIK